jgi:glycerate 2-kinase
VVIERAICEAAFREAVAACDPARLVREALARLAVSPPIVGLAVGKAALAMARGAGSVSRGLIITPAADDRAPPPRWTKKLASHPLPDRSSVDAGLAALALVESAGEDDTVLALISGGASALLEVPAPGVTLDELRAHTAELMAAGAPIAELNRVRTALSALKGGKLADRALVPVVTLVVSDVIGDDPRVIGSGPTVRDGDGKPWLGQVAQHGDSSAERDRVEVIAPMALFGECVQRALETHGHFMRRRIEPLAGEAGGVAELLAGEASPLVAWGEPTVVLPAEPGEGGRAQQLALLLARHLRGTDRAALVAGSDGIDGNASAAGAYVDGSTWDAIIAAGVSPEDALARCDAGRALGAAGALFTPGPTGINHGDVVVLG